MNFCDILAIAVDISYNIIRQKWCECPRGHAKTPGVATSGGFLFRCGWVAYTQGWLPVTSSYPTICRWGGKQHPP